MNNVITIMVNNNHESQHTHTMGYLNLYGSIYENGAYPVHVCTVFNIYYILITYRNFTTDVFIIQIVLLCDFTWL